MVPFLHLSFGKSLRKHYFIFFSPLVFTCSATRRKPIKGAAGRPIQFQYEDIVRRAKMKEQTKESQEEKRPQCFISVPLRITIFVLVAFVVLVLLTMESSPENPFEPPTEDTQLQQH